MNGSSVPAETIICQNLAGDTETDRQLRVTLLRVSHAAERIQSRLDSLGYAIADYLIEPDPILTGRLLQSGLVGLIGQLDSLGVELRKSARTLLPLTQERYSRLVAAEDALRIEEREAIEAE